MNVIQIHGFCITSLVKYVNDIFLSKLFARVLVKKLLLLATYEMVSVQRATIELWCTREVAKHERSVRVARADSRVRLYLLELNTLSVFFLKKR